MNINSLRLKKLHLALVAGATAVFAAVPAAHAVVVTSGTVNIAIPNNLGGLYINFVTGAFDTPGSGTTTIAGWDFNPYNNGGGLTFYGAGTPSGILATGTAGTSAVAQVLTPGSVISATPATGFYNQFQTTAAAFQTAGTRYVGFRFLNETTNTQNYGYALISSGATVGFPASIVSYAYENTGAAITVPVPEVSTFAMFAVALAGAAGLRVIRRKA